MRSLLTLLALLVLAGSSVLAGCLGTSPSATPALSVPLEDAAADAPRIPRVETHFLNGTIVAQMLVPIGIPGVDDGNGIAFKSRGNVSRIVVNLSWENVPGMDLNALLLAEDWCGGGVGSFPCLGKAFALGGDPENGVFADNEGTPAAPDNPSILDLDAGTLGEWARCSTCDWVAGIWTRGAAQVDYQMRVDVYYEE